MLIDSLKTFQLVFKRFTILTYSLSSSIIQNALNAIDLINDHRDGQFYMDSTIKDDL